VLIDYGSEISVRPNSIRHLPPYFQKISSFCFRAHLDSPMTIPSGGRLWTSGASDTFRKYMNAWNLVINHLKFKSQIPFLLNLLKFHSLRPSITLGSPDPMTRLKLKILISNYFGTLLTSGRHLATLSHH
jgi:hypothetical protein